MSMEGFKLFLILKYLQCETNSKDAVLITLMIYLQVESYIKNRDNFYSCFNILIAFMLQLLDNNVQQYYIKHRSITKVIFLAIVVGE